MKKRRLYTVVVLLVVGVGAVLAGMRFVNRSRIEPGLSAETASRTIHEPSHTLRVRPRPITEWYEAVGTVRPRAEARIESQITAKVVSVKVSPGGKIQKGTLLVALDNRQLKSRLDQTQQALKSATAGHEQARQGLIAAQAAFKQAQADFQRVQTYFDSQAATAQDLERAESDYLQAQAGVSRAKEALSATRAGIRQAEETVKEADIALGYTQIRAHESGEVLKRLVEPGDMATPGKPLIVLQTEGTLRLEAHVREGLIGSVRLGDRLEVSLETLDRTVVSTVEEIVPYADPQTRTFLVKAALPRVPGLYPGMFAKMRIAMAEHTIVAIPPAAVRRVGQLELIRVQGPAGWQRRLIKTGRHHGDLVEVLSGLGGDETIGWEDR